MEGSSDKGGGSDGGEREWNGGGREWSGVMEGGCGVV